MSTKNSIVHSTIFETNHALNEYIKHSFEFWHKKYIESPLNYLLIWKRIINTDPYMKKTIDKLKEDPTNSEILIQQFLEVWFYAIRKPNFDLAKKTIQECGIFWGKITNQQFRTYVDILQIIEKHWKDTQIKNFE